MENGFVILFLRVFLKWVLLISSSAFPSIDIGAGMDFLNWVLTVFVVWNDVIGFHYCVLGA